MMFLINVRRMRILMIYCLLSVNMWSVSDDRMTSEDPLQLNTCTAASLQKSVHSQMRINQNEVCSRSSWGSVCVSERWSRAECEDEEDEDEEADVGWNTVTQWQEGAISVPRWEYSGYSLTSPAPPRLDNALISSESQSDMWVSLLWIKASATCIDFFWLRLSSSKKDKAQIKVSYLSTVRDFGGQSSTFYVECCIENVQLFPLKSQC